MSDVRDESFMGRRDALLYLVAFTAYSVFIVAT